MLQNAHINNEKMLLERIAAGDEKSFALIFAHYSKVIYPFSLKLTRSEELAEDLLQEVFLKIWINRNKLTEVENFGAYLNRITRNHCYNVLRRIAHEALISSDMRKQMTEESNYTENDLIGKEIQSSLDNAVNQLTPQQKLIYSLCHQDGLKYDEVAKNKRMPFKINVNEQEEVQVLGTHFNIAAYTDEPSIETTLLEGSVRIVRGKSIHILRPGEQARLTSKGPLSIVANIDANQVMAWKNGQTLFVNEDIQTIMREVSRWYDIDVEYRGKSPNDYLLVVFPEHPACLPY